MSKRSDIRFFAAHSSGNCSVQYHPEGELLITSGADGRLKLSQDGKSSHEFSYHTEAINAFAFCRSGDGIKIATAGEDHKVLICKYPEMTHELITRFTLGVHSVSFNRSATFVAAGGEEGTIKVILTADPSQVSVLKGHQGAVRYLAYDPQDIYLVSAGCDGTLRFWDTVDNQEFINLDTLISKSDINDTQYAKFSWHPTGDFLAVPSGNDVKILSRKNNWKVSSTLKGHSKPTTIAVYSPNGRYLASLDSTNSILIWDLNDSTSGESIGSFKHDSTITGITWNPKANTIAFIDINGKYGIWKDVIPKGFSSSFSLSAEQKQVVSSQDLLTLFDFDDEEDGPAPVEKEKPKEKRQISVDDIRDPLDIIDGIEESEYQNDVQADDDMEEDDKMWNESRYDDHSHYKSSSIQRSVVSDIQGPFQPGASPSEKKRRYLVFNRVGTVIAREESSQTFIEVDFHDISRHRPIKFADHNRISIAALGDRGAVFASHASNDSVSTIMYHPIESWGANSKWTLQLPVGEDVLAISINDSFVSVATNKNLVRVFTYSGIQYHVTSIPGPVVCMSSWQSLLAVVHHTSPSPSQNSLKFTVWDITKRQIVAKDDLSITANSTLTWFGISTTGLLTSVDSNGLVRIAMDKYQQWIPVCDLNNHKSSGKGNMWPFGVTDQSINVVQLKVGEKCPSTYPKPVPQVVQFQIPLAQLDLETAQHEELVLRNSLFLDMEMQNNSKIKNNQDVAASILKQRIAIDRKLGQLFETALKQDKTEKAYNYAEFLHFENLLEGIINVVSQQRQTMLAERLSVLLNSKLQEKEDEEEEEEEQQQQSSQSYQSSQSQSRSTYDDNNSLASIPASPLNDKENDKPQNLKESDYSVSDEESAISPPKKVFATSSSSSQQAKKRKNKFSIDKKPVKSNGSQNGNVFATLNQMQESASDANKKRKFQSFFK